MLQIRPFNELDALHIAERLTPRDREESAAVADEWDVPTFIRRLSDAQGDRYIVCAKDGEPVAMGGWNRTALAHVRHMWFYRTPRCSEVLMGLHLFILRAHRAMARAGVRRFEMICMHGCPDSQVWLRRLGYRLEGILRGRGRQGQTFIVRARLEGSP